jgi:hypothetical protein
MQFMFKLLSVVAVVEYEVQIMIKLVENPLEQLVVLVPIFQIKYLV